MASIFLTHGVIILGIIGQIVVAWLTRRKTIEIHKRINGRLDTQIKAAVMDALAERENR